MASHEKLYRSQVRSSAVRKTRTHVRPKSLWCSAGRQAFVLKFLRLAIRALWHGLAATLARGLALRHEARDNGVARVKEARQISFKYTTTEVGGKEYNVSGRRRLHAHRHLPSKVADFRARFVWALLNCGLNFAFACHRHRHELPVPDGLCSISPRAPSTMATTWYLEELEDQRNY